MEELSLTLIAGGFAVFAVLTQFVIRMKEINVSKKKTETESLENNIVYFAPSFVRYRNDRIEIDENDILKFSYKSKFVNQENHTRQIDKTAENNFYLVENSIYLN
jgi:hypothetical protein